jgi:hypothetical protein
MSEKARVDTLAWLIDMLVDNGVEEMGMFSGINYFFILLPPIHYHILINQSIYIFVYFVLLHLIVTTCS